MNVSISMNDRPPSGSSPRQSGRVQVLVASRPGSTIGAILAADEGLDVIETPGLTEAKQACSQARPDAFVLEIGEATADFAEALRGFCSKENAVPVLVVSEAAEERIVTSIIKAGASGYLFADEVRYLPAA